MNPELREIYNEIRAVKSLLMSSNRINEEQAAELLGMTKGRLQNLVSRGKVPLSFYTISPINGKRFYDRDLLTGFRIQK